jgi:cellulose synthase operon protein C
MFTREQIEKYVSEGKSFADLVTLLEEAEPAPVESPLLRRAALVRSLDKALFNQVLAQDLATPETWSEFSTSADIEIVSEDPRRYAVKETTARRALEGWKAEPDNLRAFSATLAAYFANKDALEHFTHLVLADPERAQAEFLRLYADADHVFDIARCEALIRTLRHRNGLFPSLIPTELRDVLSDREQYYRSRSLFADDYWRTMAFVERPEFVKHFDEWQADETRWILHFHGKGGYGKTMFVRWLIAHRCVVEIQGKRIPVARLDSDQLDLRVLSEWPWLALVPVAQQLTVQLPDNPFKSFLESFSELVTVLRRPSGRGDEAPRATQLSRLGPEAANLGASVLQSFGSSLGASRVVVVLDTLEDLLLHHRSGLLAMLEYLADLRLRCKGLQLLLAGRYNLADANRLPDFIKQHCEERDRLLVTGFRPEESMHYLRDLRKVPEDRPLQAIVEKAKGHPLELALFADLAVANPNLTAQEVRRYPEAQYARLIERIIDRIPPSQHGVAWLLRYAVVPRRLTLDFVIDVLAKFLPDEMARRTRRDNPNEFGKEARLYSGREVWRPYEQEIATIWDQLKDYASDNSWVEMRGAELLLQPEVRVPMRQLLRNNEIFRQLQQASVDHFEQRAGLEPNHWASHAAEALYHLFHVKGIKAASQWREALRSPQALDPSARALLADVPLGPDFVGDNGRPVKYPGGALVDVDLLTEAAAEHAWALLLERLRVRTVSGSSERLAGNYRDAFRRFRRFDREANRPAVSSAQRLILQAADSHFAGQEGAAIAPLRKALRLRLDRASKVVAHYLLARSLQNTDSRESETHFARASKCALPMGEASPLSPEWIQFRRARRLEDSGALETALECYSDSLDRARKAPEGAPFIPELFWRSCRILRALGQWSKAAQMIAAYKEDGALADLPGMQLEIGRAEVGLALERHNLAAAAALPLHGTDGDAFMLAGLVCRETLQLETAESRFTSAREALSSEGSLFGPAEAVLQKVYLFLDAVGNPRQAEETLHSIPARGAATVADRPILQARVFFDLGDEKRAGDALRSILETKPDKRRQLRTLAHMVALGLAVEREAKQFLTLLARQDVAARYPLLEAFRLEGAKVKYSLAEKFRDAVPPPKRSQPDFLLRALLWGQAAPSFDCNTAARRLLQSAYEDPDVEPHMQRKLRRALHRCGATLPDAEMYLKRYKAAYTHLPELLGTAYLEEAEYAVASDQARASELAAHASDVIQRFPDASSWRLRWHELRYRLDVHKTREAMNDLLTARRAAVQTGSGAHIRSLNERLEEYRATVEQTYGDRDLLPPAAVIEISRAGKETVRIKIGENAAEIIASNPLTESRGYASAYVESIAYSRAQIVEDFQKQLRAAAKFPKSSLIELRIERGILPSLPWEVGLPLTPNQRLYRGPADPVPLRDTVLMVQNAILRSGKKIIIDGIYGPQTDAMLKEFGPNPRAGRSELLRRFAPASPAGVIVMQRSAEEERFLKRGYGLIGLDIAQLYEQHSVYARRLPDLGKLSPSLLRGASSLIHIAAGLQESSRTGEIGLETGSGSAIMSAGALDHELRRISGDGLHPFVIIDVPLPPDQYDQARQVLLRNAFCDELFRYGNTRGVLATGLAHKGELKHVMHVIAKAVSARGAAVELAAELGKLPLLMPPALFTSDPEIPVLWGGEVFGA